MHKLSLSYDSVADTEEPSFPIPFLMYFLCSFSLPHFSFISIVDTDLFLQAPLLVDHPASLGTRFPDDDIIGESSFALNFANSQPLSDSGGPGLSIDMGVDQLPGNRSHKSYLTDMLVFSTINAHGFFFFFFFFCIFALQGQCSITHGGGP